MRISADSFFERPDAGISRRSQLGRAIELSMLCMLVATTIWWPSRDVMPILAIAVVLVASFVTVCRPGWGELGFRRSGISSTLRIGAVVISLAVAGVLLMHAMMRRPLLPMLEARPMFFLFLLFVYPVNVLGQELIFRSTFFWRYRSLLSDRGMVIVSAAVFAWVHILYGSWIPVALTFVAGIIFGLLYLRYRNIWGVTLIHAALGLLVFAAGYGHYFSVRWRDRLLIAPAAERPVSAALAEPAAR